jgi:Putative Actinobacterial Holin-X, holin superfamily III
MAMPQTQRSVPEVLQDIVGNPQEIVRSEFRLAKTELKEEAAKAARPAATFGGGLVWASIESGFCSWHLFTRCLQ